MQTLYRYRPLSDFLYKELFYQELYFASYQELNDPLDLSARIEFTPKSENSIGYLIWFIFKTTLSLSENPTPQEIANNRLLIQFNENQDARTRFKKEVFQQIMTSKKVVDFVTYEQLEKSISKVLKQLEIKVEINYQQLKNKLSDLANKFLKNSHVTCFSETNDNLLMWSHYASKHMGICMEFSLEHHGFFPYEMKGSRKADPTQYRQQMSKHNVQHYTFWEQIKKVTYQADQPFVNFFEFSQVFENEFDCDLIGLSKGRWHGYAEELEKLFARKTSPWHYENEWRAVSINFENKQHPEERIRYYPIECLSSIFFGLKTPEHVKERIYNIYKQKNANISFFDGIISEGNNLEFTEWVSKDEY